MYRATCGYWQTGRVSTTFPEASVNCPDDLAAGVAEAGQVRVVGRDHRLVLEDRLLEEQKVLLIGHGPPVPVRVL